MLYKSQFPAAPLGGKETQSLLLEEHGVKWAALSPGWALGLCLAGPCSDHRSKERKQTAPHTQRERGKPGQGPSEGEPSEQGEEQSSETRLCVGLAPAAGMLLRAGQEAAVEVIPMAFPGERCRKASQVAGRVRSCQGSAGSGQSSLQ